MVDLKKDLDQYLLLKNDSKKSFQQVIKKPLLNLNDWFQKDESIIIDNSVTENQECFPKLTRTQRIVAFTVCLLTGGLFFSISMMYIPVLLIKARKFAVLYTFAMVFFILSFAFLWGPTSCLKYMFSKERITITCLYCSIALATIYFALHVQSTPLTVISVVLELVILIWLILSSVPGGVTGVKFFSKLFSKTVSTTLPV